MKVSGITPILNVSNIVASFEWFERLGWQKVWDWGTHLPLVASVPAIFKSFFAKMAREAAVEVRKHRQVHLAVWTLRKEEFGCRSGLTMLMLFTSAAWGWELK